MSGLKELIEQVPPELEPEVRDFVGALLEQKRHTKQQKLRLSWAGALKEYRDKYTSLELEKKALEWWGD